MIRNLPWTSFRLYCYLLSALAALVIFFSYLRASRSNLKVTGGFFNNPLFKSQGDNWKLQPPRIPANIDIEFLSDFEKFLRGRNGPGNNRGRNDLKFQSSIHIKNDSLEQHDQKVTSQAQARTTTSIKINAILLPGPSKLHNANEIFGGTLTATDPRVISTIKNHFLFPPSTLTYNLNDSKKEDFSMGQIDAIRPFLDFRKRGFFVECGALDGETRSNTLFLERSFQWSGLLVEGDPKNFDLLLKKNRKAYSINACLSTTTTPSTLRFAQHFNLGRILGKGEFPKIGETVKEMPCFPLESIMAALNRTTIDYFSLDVEGAELDVLQTVPFERLDIRVLSVEFFHVQKGQHALQNFMESKGYTMVGRVTHPWALANDFIFVKNSIIAERQNRYISNHPPATKIKPVSAVCLISMTNDKYV